MLSANNQELNKFIALADCVIHEFFMELIDDTDNINNSKE